MSRLKSGQLLIQTKGTGFLCKIPISWHPSKRVFSAEKKFFLLVFFIGCIIMILCGKMASIAVVLREAYRSDVWQGLKKHPQSSLLMIKSVLHFTITEFMCFVNPKPFCLGNYNTCMTRFSCTCLWCIHVMFCLHHLVWFWWWRQFDACNYLIISFSSNSNEILLKCLVQINILYIHRHYRILAL